MSVGSVGALEGRVSVSDPVLENGPISEAEKCGETDAMIEALEQTDLALAALVRVLTRYYTASWRSRMARGDDRATALAEAKDIVRSFNSAMAEAWR